LSVRAIRFVWLGLALATFVGLLLLGRHLTFWQDEWAFIGFEPSSLGAYLVPHNEHWSTVPLLIYRAILAVVGLHSYLPYLAVLVAIHVVAAGGAFVLLVRRLPPLAALLAVVPLLVIGSGYENVLWAFQIGFVSSVAAGTWGIVALETNGRRWTAAAGTGLLVVALASSGMGLFFVVAAAVRLLVDPRIRRRVVWLVAPLSVYVAWYLAYGRQGLSAHLAEPGAALVFAGRGLGYAVARMTGFDLAGHAPFVGVTLAIALLGSVVLVVAVLIARRTLPPLALGGFVAVVTMYGVLGVTRADLAADFATRSRYVYVAAFLLIPAFGDLIGWLWAGRRVPPAVVVGLLALACLSIGANILDLIAGRNEFASHARLTRAYLEVISEREGRTSLDPNGLLLGWPDFEQLDTLLTRYGSPVRDTLVASDATPPRPEDLERATVSLVGTSFRVVAGAPPDAGHAVASAILGVRSARITPAGLCVDASGTGSASQVTVSVPDGGWLEITAPGAALIASLGRALPPTTRLQLPMTPGTGGPATLALPFLGDGSSWQVTFTPLPSGTVAHLCVYAP
jgi:hypothetical protein